MTKLKLLILLLSTVIPGFATVLPDDLDRVKAERYLDGRPLSGPEGLWEFEPDEITLMVLRDDINPGTFCIYVVDAVDCRLTPGMKIGTLESSIDPKSYRIYIRSRWNKGSLDMPLDGLAKLDSKSETLIIEGKSGKFSVTPSIILPNLLSLLRLRVRISVNDPTVRIPKGLRRIYPLPSDLPDAPRYL